MSTCTHHNWAVLALAVDHDRQPGGVTGLVDEPTTQQLVTVRVTLTGTDVASAPGLLGGVPGVVVVDQADDDSE